MQAERKRFRCALYTRKSSEEGLEQSFNSLDAQREACLAYVQSQRHEGWKALDTVYDDGGYSGGTIDRPALQALLADIGARKIDVVVVYKVDRLTRSLADFAKIVELFDARGVSFVSVTQQFNTTSSMGRLTLNVLLSFAQFEREVTGERIRDKIAASKKKGMWMGGHVPLGYDLQGRKLTANKREAEIVRGIFERYLALGCVRKLQAEMKTKKILSKKRVSAAGAQSGGLPYSRGALYSILQNRLYIGEIAHRGAVHAGEHAPLVHRDLWEKVQARLKSNGQARRNGAHAKSPSLLAGLLFGAQGERFTPLHSTKKGKRYRYYVSQAVIRNGAGATKELARIPAHDIEQLVSKRLQTFLRSSREVLDLTSLRTDTAADQQALVRTAKACALTLSKGSIAEARGFMWTALRGVTVTEKHLEIRISKTGLRHSLTIEANASSAQGPAPEVSDRHSEDEITLRVEARFKRLGGEVRMVIPAENSTETPGQANDVLVKAIARARRWYEMLASGEIESLHALAKATGLNERYVSRVLKCAFLAPDIVKSIVEGAQPKSLSLDLLMRHVPAGWNHQRDLFAPN